MSLPFRLVVCLVLACPVARSAETDPGRVQIFPAVEPPAAVATLRVQKGFTLELLAAEPLLASPVAVACDEDGNAFVAEMRDYSTRTSARIAPARRTRPTPPWAGSAG